MAQSGWRLPPELLKRVRVRCAETGERQNAFVERALESALGDEQGGGPSGNGPRGRAPAPAPSRAPEPYKLPPSAPTPKAALPAGVKTAREIASERQVALNKAKGP